MQHFSRSSRALALMSAVAATSLAPAAPASAQESFKLGIVTFLSGPAADGFGVPARNGATYVIDQRTGDRPRLTRRSVRRHEG
jgi:branched-chain amino acid transport system substrate-binding protein